MGVGFGLAWLLVCVCMCSFLVTLSPIENMIMTTTGHHESRNKGGKLMYVCCFSYVKYGLRRVPFLNACSINKTRISQKNGSCNPTRLREAVVYLAAAALYTHTYTYIHFNFCFLIFFCFLVLSCFFFY